MPGVHLWFERKILMGLTGSARTVGLYAFAGKVDPEGPDSVTDPTEEGTYKFLEKFVDEMAKLFPDTYFTLAETRSMTL
jgi:hypothetical protein